MYDELIKALRNNADHYGYEAEDVLVHLLTNAADAIEALSKMETTTPRWISVEEALPEKYGTVLVTTERGSVMVCCYYPQAKNWNTRAKVKWWMPKPEPPKEET